MENAVAKPKSEKTLRKRRALRITGILTFALALPFAAMIYLRMTRGDSLRDLGEVAPFVVKDRAGAYFDHTQLTKHVTVVAYFPENCENANSQAPCASMKRLITDISEWLEKQLAANAAKNRNPVQLMIIAPEDLPLDSSWRIFDREAFAAQNQMVPDHFLYEKGAIYVIDPNRHFRGRYQLDDTGAIDWESFKVAMSRMTMSLYFNDYLSKRTFFGPVKAKPTPSHP